MFLFSDKCKSAVAETPEDEGKDTHDTQHCIKYRYLRNRTATKKRDTAVFLLLFWVYFRLQIYCSRINNPT